ncbi:FHA domain-containing protein [Paraburkholderia sp.]|jgi:pSer/pThr/pTyr-binding forkhead associated (FHA) protein|uniref:FHA domain-containing protein n=1 Tax=Paraburkholderia sp. TaxID=1926495 RepID=UPI002F3F8EF6
MTPGEAPIAERQATQEREFDIVLSPVSHPELGVIRISDSLFAIGRSEAPFESYPGERLTRLSRRHARIFVEHDAVYVADLDSKNGTTLNGASVRHTPSRMRAGDELCFGGELTYRVGLQPRSRSTTADRAALVVGLILLPERDDLGLQQIEVHSFPFLISKADELFARYKELYPHQVNYISRRHAHVFLKGDELWVEDLGSTNGTFVDGKRLAESAVALHDGDRLAFGGDHFVYKVQLRKALEVEPTVTQLFSANAPPDLADPDKTTFVGAANSFLDIFCVDQALKREDEVNEALPSSADDAKDAKDEASRRHGQARWRIFAAELLGAFAGAEGPAMRRKLCWGLAVLAVLLMAGSALYMRGASQRELKTLLATGQYERAIGMANQYLERHPADTEMEALASEVLLKARVPGWLAALQQHDFDRAAALIAQMQSLSKSNADAAVLVGELAWVGELERFLGSRGGADAPIRLYADEDQMSGLLARWNDDPQGHQRLLDRISSYVPAFAEPYARAMSDLRKLQSDVSVYLPAIGRLNATIDTQLSRGNPDALQAVFNDTAEKYPRLAGLDRLRGDLQKYTAVLNEMRARRLGALLTLMKGLQFSTPPFQAQYGRLAANGLPSTELVRQYDAVAAAWQRGDGQQALAGLQSMPASPWSDALVTEQEHKKAVFDQFGALQKARGSKDYDAQLLSFYGGLDPVEDAWFVHAIQGDVAAMRDKALARAQDWLTHAQALWREYRSNGAIGGTQRLESGISEQFRSQARRLSEAQSNAQQGMRIFAQLKANHPADWDHLRDDIDAEVQLQRRSLQELRMVLEPGLLQAKLALIGGAQGEARQSP